MSRPDLPQTLPDWEFYRALLVRTRILIASLAALAGCASPTGAPSVAGTPRVPPAALAPAPLPATDEDSLQQRFDQWVAAFEATAHAQGITDATLHAAFDPARYLARVVTADSAQPEFTRTVWDYLDVAVSSQRVAQGQQALVDAQPAADAAAARYGVPAPVLVAVWGIESNFGGNTGDIPAIDALATLGVDGRRSDFAREELLAALRILQRGDVDRAHLVGSWAGALGQTQFLPSKYLAYAVDADGDGRVDIWGSLPDVLASTANFLAHVGWRADEPWGVEVRLPGGFDPARADPSLRQASAQWAAEGVRALDDAALPTLADASVLQPAGVRGPAFLVGAGFRAFLRYNNSTSYALAVGLLGQRLAGGPGVQAPWPRDLATLGRSQVQVLQAALAAKGYDPGTPDGLVGPATREALRRYQRSVGLPADGFATLDLLQRLQAP